MSNSPTPQPNILNVNRKCTYTSLTPLAPSHPPSGHIASIFQPSRSLWHLSQWDSFENAQSMCLRLNASQPLLCYFYLQECILSIHSTSHFPINWILSPSEIIHLLCIVIMPFFLQNLAKNHCNAKILQNLHYSYSLLINSSFIEEAWEYNLRIHSILWTHLHIKENLARFEKWCRSILGQRAILHHPKTFLIFSINFLFTVQFFLPWVSCYVQLACFWGPIYIPYPKSATIDVSYFLSLGPLFLVFVSCWFHPVRRVVFLYMICNDNVASCVVGSSLLMCVWTYP